MRPYSPCSVLLVSFLLPLGCSGSTSASNEPPGSGRHGLDFGELPGGAAGQSNSSVVFRPDGSASVVQAVQNRDFIYLYNRIGCRTGAETTMSNDDEAATFFGQLGGNQYDSLAPHAAVSLSALTVEMPDNADLHDVVACYAYRTTDGIWHGHFDAVAAVHDVSAGVWRATLQVNAAHVDMIGIPAEHMKAVSFVGSSEP